MSHYKSGILMPDSCECSDPDKNEVNHAVTIVGYGPSTTHGCHEYWLVKNTWGNHWVEYGFFRICADRKGNQTELGAC
jgi:cathepsin F